MPATVVFHHCHLLSAICYLSVASRDGAFNPALGRIGRQKKCVLVVAAERSEVNQQAMQI